MRRSLLLYLFILAVLMNIFTYVYFSKQAAAEGMISGSTNKRLKDSLELVKNQLYDANYFTLENDQNAQNYIADNNLDKIIPYDQFSAKVIEQLMDHNDKPEGNPYTGQTQLGARKFIINKAKVLNHRWIVADYSDGEYWGEVLIKYFINQDKTVSFEVVESFLYQK